MPCVAVVARVLYASGGLVAPPVYIQGDSSSPPAGWIHTGLTNIASQPVVRIITSSHNYEETTH